MRESIILGIGIAMVSLLVLLSAVHVFWALGGQWGKGAVLPERDGQPVFRPGAAAAIVVAIVLLGAAGVLALRAGVLSLLLGGPAVQWVLANTRFIWRDRRQRLRSVPASRAPGGGSAS